MSSSFTFNQEEFTAAVRGWEDLLTDIADARTRFGGLGDLASRLPAADLITRTFLGHARSALDAAHGSNEAVGDYVEGFLTKLRAAERRYVTDDDRVTGTFNLTVGQS